MRPTSFGVGGAAVALAFAASACSPAHVHLEAPPATAEAEVRLAAYQTLRPARLRLTRVTDLRTNSSNEYADSVELNGGARVKHIADLLPVVHPQSRTADDIRLMQSKSSTAKWFLYGGLAALGSSLVLMVADMSSNGPRNLGAPFYLGAGLGIGGIIAIPIGQYHGRQANEAGIDAVKHYDDGLLRRLDLCNEHGGVTPCR
jgi:hypothetical protein